MNDYDDLDNDFVEHEVPSVSLIIKAEASNDTRRLLDDRLEESRVEKQTRDYDFDLG